MSSKAPRKGPGFNPADLDWTFEEDDDYSDARLVEVIDDHSCFSRWRGYATRYARLWRHSLGLAFEHGVVHETFYGVKFPGMGEKVIWFEAHQLMHKEVPTRQKN